MNTIEREMVEKLKALHEQYGCVQIKAEFEAEGTRMAELARLKDIVSTVGLPIVMKIGGVESLTDVYNCLEVGVATIVAPMVETSFALSKYAKMVKNMIAADNIEEIDFFFNMETITGYNNFQSMMDSPFINQIDGVTIGRVDLTASMDMDRNDVDSEQIFEICTNTFRKAREHNLLCGLGGAISTKSMSFIKRLNQEQLIDKFETRKVVFSSDAIQYGEQIFTKAIEFELLWLKSKRRYYSLIKAEDETRIEMLEKRING